MRYEFLYHMSLKVRGRGGGGYRIFRLTKMQKIIFKMWLTNLLLTSEKRSCHKDRDFKGTREKKSVITTVYLGHNSEPYYKPLKKFGLMAITQIVLHNNLMALTVAYRRKAIRKVLPYGIDLFLMALTFLFIILTFL